MKSVIKITGSLVNAYFICKRKAWLFSRQLSPDPEHEFLELGRLITEEAYKRERKEIEFEGIKIDVIRKNGGDYIIGEIKKSSSAIKPALMQLAFYLYTLQKQGIVLKGELLVPKERKRIHFVLDEETEKKLKQAIEDMKILLCKETPPAVKRNKYCKTCAYFEFCFV